MPKHSILEGLSQIKYILERFRTYQDQKGNWVFNKPWLNRFMEVSFQCKCVPRDSILEVSSQIKYVLAVSYLSATVFQWSCLFFLIKANIEKCSIVYKKIQVYSFKMLVLCLSNYSASIISWFSKQLALYFQRLQFMDMFCVNFVISCLSIINPLLKQNFWTKGNFKTRNTPDKNLSMTALKLFANG